MDRSIKTELSLATSTTTPGGKSFWIFSIKARTPADKSRGFAVAWRMTPTPIASLPLSRTLERSSAGPCATRATSPMRTGKPLTVLTITCENSPGRLRSVAAVTLNSRKLLSIRPAGTSKLERRSASSTSWMVNRNAANFAGSNEICMENLRSPEIVTSAAPGAVCSMGLTKVLAISESCRALWVSELNDKKMTGNASASTLAMTGSSMPCGRRCRTRETLSRTSAAAESASRDRAKRIEIWLRSWRLLEVMTSTPSMPARESSSTLVTCASTTSLDAPPNRVVTVTTGSSIFGYSRTDRPVKDTAPINMMSKDSTVAKTGRRMDVSANCMMHQPPEDRAAGALAGAEAAGAGPLPSSTMRTGVPSRCKRC